MLAPKCATYHGRSTFANPKYLKKAQSDKPRLYEIPYDTSDPANRFCPDGEETVTLEKEIPCLSFCGQIVYIYVEKVAPFDVKYKKDTPAGNPDYPSLSEIHVMGHQFKVFVGNLPNDVSSADLKNKCSEYEEVSEARIVFKRGRRPCGYGYL
ncbi:integrase, catalytic region, zinc finger, CCHC-type containing protein [Tanacetum coccineum]